MISKYLHLYTKCTHKYHLVQINSELFFFFGINWYFPDYKHKKSCPWTAFKSLVIFSKSENPYQFVEVPYLVGGLMRVLLTVLIIICSIPAGIYGS